MSDTNLPIFCGTKPTLPNTCAKCGTDSTAGCWRRGWKVGDFSANLCNRCGLQFKNGKLESSFYEERQDDSVDVSHTSSIVEASDSPGPYIAFSCDRQADGSHAKKVLFYVYDTEGVEKLALIGNDPRGTGHFTYESVEGFHPPLKCKNRRLVRAWLEDMGAVRGIERPADGSSFCLPLNRSGKTLQRPSFNKEYCDYRVEKGIDGDIESENFYFVDAEGQERLVICGGTQDDCSRYRCVIPDHDVIFDDRLDVIAWMEWCVGKSEKPPERFLKKELDKAIRSRECYSSSLPEGSSSKRRMMLSKIDEMQEIFGDAELTRWVLRKPSSEEIDMFYDWRKKLTVGPRGLDTDNNDKTDPHELLELLQDIQQKESCLKLLELSSLGQPISALRRHPNEEVANVAGEITQKWNNWTAIALEKATAAMKSNASAY